MIVDYKSLCKEVSKENNLDLDLLISINNTVFNEVFNWTKNPTSLKIYLKHFGSFFFKKRKTVEKIEMYNRVLTGNLHLPLLDVNREKIHNKIKNYNFILSEYDKYMKERYEIKCEKYGKEAYEAFCLAKKQEKIQKTKENKSI